jgi:hypothetical protein
MNQQQMEQEVARLADNWATAELQIDTAFLERLLSADQAGVDRVAWVWRLDARRPHVG